MTVPVEERLWVKDLRAGSEVEELYSVCAKELRQGRSGSRYLALTLGDRSGQVAALAWENVERIAAACEPGGVAKVRGQVQLYNQHLQIVVRRADAVPVEEVDLNLFVRASAVDPEVLWGRLQEQIAAVSNPHLRQLLYRVFSDPEVEGRFRQAPAARGMHHAYRAGLLEHTVSTAAAARLLAAHYQVDPDLAATGALLHDLGKVWELELGAAIRYTDEGQLLGHLTLGTMFVERALAELKSFPAELRRHLLHVLLAHHGEYEFGSPRRPKTPEALIVYMADNLDSKLAGMMEAMGGNGEGDEAWSAYSPILDRRVYRRRPPTGD